MSPVVIRMYRNRIHFAEQQVRDAKLELVAAHKEYAEFLRATPPKTFRLQEAYRNPDGSYAPPHWDEVANYAKHSLIAQNEVNDHILREGEWTVMIDYAEDDPRPGCRRVIEVTW